MKSDVLLILGAVVLAAVACASEPPETTTPEKVRESVVAGIFYEADPAKLAAQVDSLLEKAKKARLPEPPRALVSPHAGLEHSGIVAAAGYAAMPRDVKRVLILAPSHRHAFAGVSIPDVDAYFTPLGLVPLDPAAKELAAQPGFSHVPEAHMREHSLEVQLPFLQRVLGDFTLIPLVVGSADPGELAETLLPLAREGVFFIASSDLSHGHPYRDAKKLDAFCTMAISNLMFYAMDRCEACGKQPVETLMRVARSMGWKGKLLDARNSADTSGPMAEVVGYASIAFVREKGEEPMPEEITEQDKKALLELARSTIRSRLFPGEAIKRPEAASGAIRQNRGCFVTLHKNGQLRGCIGTIEPVMPLADAVEENAINAAFKDPRFTPLTADELDQVTIEISVLTVPKPLPFSDGEDLKRKLRPGIDGVILARGMNRATFLPQVWGQVPDAESFLTMLCRKGGMSGDCWCDPSTQVFTYQAEHFEEK
ncbi:MAG: AmmeMemoRadiSam system protein B [Deltaproteobacteria bacterium]|nr:AmmeMemoRadiSam system protein B [Deltaproteobacteria bacterium]